MSYLSLKIAVDAWWASMNVCLKRPIAWNNARHAPSWQFHLHCAIQETGSPGIRYIIGHHVPRHPSEHGIRLICKQLQAKAHTTKLNQ
jgi:hypothetical protein